MAEVRVSVLVDRGYNPESRSLRWDILPIGVRGGVLHPKVALLGAAILAAVVCTAFALFSAVGTSSFLPHTE